jgi:CubicO group peptidase (beta-lactamase class C family)
MTPRLIATLIVFLLMTNAATTSAFDAKPLKPAEEAIAKAIEEKNIPGAVLLAGTRDKVVFAKSYGNRAVEPAKEPMTDDTIFDLASLSKPIGCATSVLILIDRGKISLTDPVAKHLPEFGNNGKEKITVEMLLRHHGGLIPDNSMKDYVGTHAEMIDRVMKLKPTSEPGTKFAYTDVGFIVLGELVKRVSGKPLETFAKEEIFTPLGMKDTSYLPPKEWAARTAPTEKRNGQWIRGEVHDPRAYALGGVAGHAGLFGTADDVGRWVRMLLNGGKLGGKRILSADIVKQMLTVKSLPDGKGARGLGVDIDSSYAGVRGDRYEKGTTFGHTGWTGTMFWADPVNGVFHVLLTNRVHPDGKGEVKELRKAVSTAAAEALLGPAAAGPAGDGK